MTIIHGDVRNVADIPTNGELWVSSPEWRPSNGAVVTMVRETYHVVDGKFETGNLKPGAVQFEFSTSGAGQTRRKAYEFVIPDTERVNFANLLENAYEYPAEVVGKAQEAARRAEAARDQAVTAASEAVETVKQIDADFASQEELEAQAWLRPALTEADKVDDLTSGLYPVPTSTVAAALNLPLGEPGELETTWLDASGLRRRQTLRVDPYTGSRPGYAMYRRWYYNGVWQPWARYDDSWHKGVLSGTEKLSELAQGAYEIRDGSRSTALGLPVAERGTLSIYWIANGLYRRAVFDVDPTSGYRQYRSTYYNGTWANWKLEVTSSTPFFRGKIPTGTTPNEMIGNAFNGEWTFFSGNQAEWGIPSNASGLLYVSASGSSTLQELTTFTTPIQKYQRRAYNGTWSGPWEPLTGGTTAPAPVPAATEEYGTAAQKGALNALVPTFIDPTASYATDRETLVTGLRARLGDVRTVGKAAVALVADHGTTAFKEWLWAAAKERNLPFTMAIAPEAHLDGRGDSRHSASNDDVRKWVSEGLVIASHSGDHGGATGYVDVHRQIVTSKKKLEEKLETPVDCWVQPGYSLSLGNYDGFGTGQTAAVYNNTYGGRLLQQTYPVITGYASSEYVYPGNADLPVGARRSLMERKEDLQGVREKIQQAIDTGGKHINFCHPYSLLDSSTTYVTKAEYIEYLDWLVQKRDAGELVLLTLPQLAISRP